MSEGLRFEPGMFVSTRDGEKFAVVKILARDEGGVHVRLYPPRFGTRLQAGGVPPLTAEWVGEDEPLSLGHIPVSHDSFQAWEPEFMAVFGGISEDELEGYRIWEKANGGYF